MVRPPYGGARAGGLSISPRNTLPQNLHQVCWFKRVASAVSLAIPLLCANGNHHAIKMALVLFATFWLAERLTKPIIGYPIVKDLPKVNDLTVRLVRLFVLLLISVPVVTHYPSMLSSVFLLLAGDILDIVDVCGDWSFTRSVKSREVPVRLHSSSLLNGALVLAGTATVDGCPTRLLFQTTSVGNRASPHHRGWLCSFV